MLGGSVSQRQRTATLYAGRSGEDANQFIYIDRLPVGLFRISENMYAFKAVGIGTGGELTGIGTYYGWIAASMLLSD